MSNMVRGWLSKAKYAACLLGVMTLMVSVISSGLVDIGSGPRVAAQDEVCLEVSQEGIPAISTAQAVAAGDFNEDDHLDLAVVSHLPLLPDKGLVILQGDGSGGFSSTEFLPVGDHNHGLITADLNRDGHLDVATSTSIRPNPTVETNVVHLFFGDGTGHFPRHEMIKFDVRVGPLDVQAADLNKDDNPDLVVTGAGDEPVGVLLGDGTGAFTPPRFFGGGILSTRASAIADFNGDGNPDIVATHEYRGLVSLFLGDGMGNFRPSKKFQAGTGPRSVVAADFDEDGNQDVAVTNRTSNDVSILFGDGRGWFSPALEIKVGRDPRTVQAGDFNGDGRLDIAVTSALFQTVTLLLGDGQRNFSLPIFLRVGDAPVRHRQLNPVKGPNDTGLGIVGLAAADINGDESLDLVATSTFDGNIYILMNRCQ